MFEIKDYTLSDGRAKGVRCLDIDCGELEFTLVADRCLDIYKVKYRGKQLTFLSKNGIVAPQYYDPAGYGWLKSFAGGLLVTCGLANAGEPCELDGQHHGLHGRISHIPAENVSVTRNNDEITVCGTVRETVLMGYEYELKRELKAKIGGNTIVLCDRITNRADVPAPLMLLYHINFGGNLLGPNTRVAVPESVAIEPFDDCARENLASWNTIPEPVAGAPEQVFLHTIQPDKNGFAGFSISGGGIRVNGTFAAAELPYLGFWKSLRPGDYAVAFEPCNNHIMGVAWEKAHGGLRYLAPGECAETSVKFSFEEG